MISRRFAACVLAGIVLLPGIFAKPSPEAKPAYQYSRLGSDFDVNPTLTPLIVLSGGGTGVVEAYTRMCIANNGGDFLVLGTATYDKSYSSYIRKICIDSGKPANSVATLVVPSFAAANDGFVAQTVRNAEAVWIAGGDQSRYIEHWTSSALQSALNDTIWRGVAIGGISAGLNVLTEFMYTAQGTTTVTSSFALANPDSPSITIGRKFVNLPVLEGFIGDPHFSARDRMGRDLAFLYRIYKATTRMVRTISVDEATSVIVRQDPANAGQWDAEILGAGKAYFLQTTQSPPNMNGSSLDGVYVDVYRVRAGGVFNLSDTVWTGANYKVWALGGVLHSNQPGGSIY